MGLDGVELVMDVEDHFGITIANSEAVEIRTVGDLVELCRRRLAAAAVASCPSLTCFLSLRRATREVMADPHLRIRPAELIADRVPTVDRRALWRNLATFVDLDPPALRRPRRLTLGLWSISVIVTVLTGYFDPVWLMFSVPAGVLTPLVLFSVTDRLRTEPPAGFATFGDITRWMVGLHCATKPTAGADPAAVLEELRPIIAKVLGVDHDEIVPEAQLVEDLGMA